MTNKDKFDYEFEILDFWKKNNIFDKVNTKNSNGKLFSWVEGPPYPTGEQNCPGVRDPLLLPNLLQPFLKGQIVRTMML